MILPEPESDLRMNILVLGNEVLGELIKNKDKEVLIEDLLMSFLKKDVKRTPKLFLDVITVLFAFGLIERKGYKIQVVFHDNIKKNLL